MTINLVKISSVDLPHHPAYVAMNLKQAWRICELLQTESTVWSQREIDILGAMAADGKVDMHAFCNHITIAIKDK